jgi:hypothetical protein
MGAHMRLQGIAFVKQLHGVLSASAKATFSGNTNPIISSLVLSDYFIHSYHFGLGLFLILQTYSKYGDTSYGCMHLEAISNIRVVQMIWEYLNVS